MEKFNALKSALVEAIQFPIFSGLSLDDLEGLCQSGQVVVSSHRDKVFQFNDPADYFGFVLSGAYKLSRPTPAGDEIIVHFTTPGDFVAAFIMAQPKPVFPVTVTAMGPSRFVKIPRSVFLSAWKNRPELILKIQSELSSRMGQMHTQKALQKAPLSAKVAALLMELVERHANQNEMIVPLPLTRKEIADSLGASVESVIRIMSDWSKRGLIQTSDQNIKIIKPEQIILEMSVEEA